MRLNFKSFCNKGSKLYENDLSSMVEFKGVGFRYFTWKEVERIGIKGTKEIVPIGVEISRR